MLRLFPSLCTLLLLGAWAEEEETPDGTPAPTFTNAVTGGTLYIYSLNGNAKEVLDFHELALQANCVPHRRPHMVRPNRSTKIHSHVLIPYFDKLSGIHVMDVKKRRVLACFSTADYGPGLVHDVVWSPADDFFVAIDLAGSLHKFSANLKTNEYKYENSFDLKPYKEGLGTEEGPKPISCWITRSGVVYVTMAHGGAVVLRANEPKQPMTHLHTYSAEVITGTGGLWAFELGDGTVMLEYGTQDAEKSDFIHMVDAEEAALNDNYNTVKSVVIPGIDAHGVTTCERANGQQVLMITNRLTTDLALVDVATLEVLQVVTLKTERFTEQATDFAYYYDNKLYIAFRGPKPLSALKKQNPKWTSGTAIYNVEDCLTVEFERFMEADVHRNVENGGVTDVHGLSVVFPKRSEPELWSIDQAATTFYDSEKHGEMEFANFEEYQLLAKRLKTKTECLAAGGRFKRRRRGDKCTVSKNRVRCRRIKDADVCRRVGCSRKEGRGVCKGQPKIIF